DWNLLFWVDAATALAYSALALTLLPNLPAPPEEDEEPPASGYGVLLRDRRYLLYLASVLLGAAVYVQYAVALPLKITKDGHPAALYSVVLTMSSLILILCELKITTYVRRFPTYAVGAAGTALVGLGVAGYGLSTTSTVLILVSTVVF